MFSAASQTATPPLVMKAGDTPNCFRFFLRADKAFPARVKSPAVTSYSNLISVHRLESGPIEDAGGLEHRVVCTYHHHPVVLGQGSHLFGNVFTAYEKNIFHIRHLCCPD